MAKVIESKSGKRYIQLDAADLSNEEQGLLQAVLEARAAERTAMAALRDEVLTRDEFFDRGLTVYVDWGKIKVTKAPEGDTVRKPAKPTLSLSDAMAQADLDGLAR